MATGRDIARSQDLVEVAFVGGPLHGCYVQMSKPEFEMTLEAAPGRPTIYKRQMVEEAEREGESIYRATYAPVGTTEDEFARLVVRAALR
jgi:hypothetical protein